MRPSAWTMVVCQSVPSTVLSKAVIVLFVTSLAAASGQAISRPDVPAKLAAPAGEDVVLATHATGFQIYACQADPDQKFAWTLKAPDAVLHDKQGKPIGRHFAGPTWKLNDGSEVTGKAIAQEAAPDGKSVAWLLLAAASHSGPGVLSRVTTIQRIHTNGGMPGQSACDAAQQGREKKVPYSADYYFYAPKQ